MIPVSKFVFGVWFLNNYLTGAVPPAKMRLDASSYPGDSLSVPIRKQYTELRADQDETGPCTLTAINLNCLEKGGMRCNQISHWF
jgi:hypothetical protein